MGDDCDSDEESKDLNISPSKKEIGNKNDTINETSKV